MKQSLSCSVVRLEEQVAVLRTADGQTFTLPLTAIHGTPTPSGTIRLIGIVTDGGQVDDSPLAKTILNELLSPKS